MVALTNFFNGQHQAEKLWIPIFIVFDLNLLGIKSSLPFQ